MIDLTREEQHCLAAIVQAADSGAPLSPALSRLAEAADVAFRSPALAVIAKSLSRSRSLHQPHGQAALIEALPDLAADVAALGALEVMPAAVERDAQPLLNRLQLLQLADLGANLSFAAESNPEHLAMLLDQADSTIQHIRGNGTLLSKANLARQELLNRAEGRRFNYAVVPEKPEPRFWIGETPIATPGNLCSIAAALKSGKTALVDAMLAATLTESDDADTFTVRSGNPNGMAVVHFDTEQSPYDHDALVRRILKRAKIQAPPPWFHSYSLAGFAPLEIRAIVPILVRQAAEAHGGLHSVFLDGSADLVNDVNDQQETLPLVAELHALAIETKSVLVPVIHFNPGTTKTRGHLGSQLERKAESNLEIEKDADDVCTIFALKNRRAPIPKHAGPAFIFSPQTGMHVSTQNPNHKPHREATHQPEDVVDLLGNRSLGATDWEKEAKDELGMSRATFFRLKKTAVKAKQVLQNPADRRWFRA